MGETQIDNRALQLKGLEILKAVADVCERHGLRYFLAFGTLLGAIRHQGFIPWDDDIDIGMPREDFEIFRRCAGEELAEQHIAVLDPSQVRHTTRMFLKVHDTQTTYIAANAHYPDVYFGVFIDVFPYDGFPDSKLEGWLLRRRYKALHYLDHALRFPVRKRTAAQKLKAPVITLLKKLLPYDWAYKRREKLMKKHSVESCKRSFMEVFGKLHIYPSDCILRTEMRPFEDGWFPCPADYETSLTLSYGDWRTLPPEEKRVATHEGLYISLDKSYLTRWWEREQDG